MNIFEQEIIDFALAAVLAVIKNPAKAAALRTQLLGVADQIDTAYGLTPPTHT